MHEFQQQQNSLAQAERTSISAQNGPARDPSTGIDPARRYPPLHERTGSTYVQVSILVQAHGNLPARVGINPCARGSTTVRIGVHAHMGIHPPPPARGSTLAHAWASNCACAEIYPHVHRDPPKSGSTRTQRHLCMRNYLHT